MADHIVLTWDYRQQPDLDMLASAVREISGDTCHLRAVEDTGGQDYAIVVSRDQLSMDEAQEAYLAHHYRSEGSPNADAQPAPAVLFGARCTDPTHPGTGTVYALAHGQHRLQGLAQGVPCYELVRSRDGGKTWES